MWDCEHCGTTNIAGGLEVCPHCQEPRTGDEPELRDDQVIPPFPEFPAVPEKQAS